MKSKKILIDVSLTGGRGAAKKTKEFIEDCAEQKVNYEILTDTEFVRKLKELNISADYIIEGRKSENPSILIEKYARVLNNIDFDVFVKFGARPVGAEVARRLRKPYFIVDGGLPDMISTNEDDSFGRFYEETYKNAEKFYLTTQFDWDFPKRLSLENIEVGTFPISQKTLKKIDSIKLFSREELLDSIKSKLQGELPKSADLLINLVLTDDYIAIPAERITYGGWLSTRFYDQCVGFIRRLVTDLGEIYSKEVFLFVDMYVARIVQDLLMFYPQIKVLSFKNWDFDAELTMKAVADCTISRATNYQPYIAALEKGGNVTTPVPADGYMDEDSAGIQYEEKGLTKLIPYDAEDYVAQLVNFIEDRSAQKKISLNLKKNREFLINDSVTVKILNYLNTLK